MRIKVLMSIGLALMLALVVDSIDFFKIQATRFITANV